MRLPDQNELADALRRGRLTAQEKAQIQTFLAGHPEERTFWDEELTLDYLLRQVPNAPLPSNFTARVMQSVRHDSPGRPAVEPALWCRVLLARWALTLGTATAVLCLSLFSHHYHEMAVRRQVAVNLAQMTRLANGNSLEWLENFDAIERLNQVPHDTDRELVAALQ